MTTCIGFVKKHAAVVPKEQYGDDNPEYSQPTITLEPTAISILDPIGKRAHYLDL